MRNQKHQCLLIGKSSIFTNLVKVLGALETKIQLRQAVHTKQQVAVALKSMKGASIVFVSDESPFPFPLLSNLISQFNRNAIVVIITQKTASTSPQKLFNRTHFAKLNVKKNNSQTQLLLRSLIQLAEDKEQFRKCKSLLSIAEKRCQWLVDSSSEAIAFISKDLHLYANTTYLALFGFESMQALRAESIKNLIVKDEAEIFDSFLKYQIAHQQLSHTLLLSMKDSKGIGFRVNLHAIPSVLKGQKCWQLWVHKLNTVVTESKSKEELRKESYKLSNSRENLQGNPFEGLNKELSEKKKKADSDLILKGIIKRKEVSITALKLVSLDNKPESKADSFHSHYILSLNVPVAQRKAVDDLLFRSTEIDWSHKRQIFWDKVKVARLIQVLSKKIKSDDNYLITLSHASICNPVFTQWMLRSLKHLGKKSKSLTVMIPSQLESKERDSTVEFVQNIKLRQCQIALNEFTPSASGLKMLGRLRPSFVRLSLEWVRKLESNEKNKIALGSLIRQLEERKVQVIAPCSFSSEMRKIFVSSGASFCQERSTNTA